jgi:hypothetical protein
MEYDWKKDLDDCIWPHPWPHSEKQLCTMKALYLDNETSKKQLEYMHIYLYHNRLAAAKGPKIQYYPYTVQHWSKYYGYSSGSKNSNAVMKHYPVQNNGTSFKKNIKHMWINKSC